MKTSIPVSLPPTTPRVDPQERPALDNGAFVEALTRAGVSLASTRTEAAQAVESFATVGGPNIHETMLAMEKANISLKYMVSVRDRLLDAYREVMRMGM